MVLRPSDPLELGDESIHVARRRRRGAFYSNVAAVICDGERCIRPICDDHRWSAAEELDLFPCPVSNRSG
jgi:hypothetical protein